MEVNNSPKQLHKHAVPIVTIVVAALVIPAVFFTADNSQSRLGRALVTQVLHVEPTSNGLAKITWQNQASPPDNLDSQVDLSETGRSAHLTLVLQ